MLQEENISESKDVEISIELKNFEGLNYDIEDDAEFEVIATILNGDLKHGHFKENFTELLFKISVERENYNDLFILFSYPLLLTLIKHENEKTETIGFCSIDLSRLFSKKLTQIECRKKFEISSNIRKISVDVKISTNFPLLLSDYENCLLFTLDSIHHSQFTNDGNNKILIGYKVPYLNEIDKNVIFTINSSNDHTEICRYKFKRWCSLYNIPGNASNSNYHYENYEFQLKCEEMCLLQTSKNHTSINTVFKSLMMTQEACYTFHDHIRKSNKLPIEILINDNAHLFGLIDCEELLHVGRKRIRAVVQLYNFDNELFRKYSDYESVLYKLKPDYAKNRKSTRKVSNIITKSLDDNKALDENGYPIFIVLEMELEKPLNEELFEEDLTLNQLEVNSDENLESSFDSCLIDDLRNDVLWNAENLIQKYKNDDLRDIIIKALNNGDLVSIQNSILPKMEAVTNELSRSSDYDTIFCRLTSNFINFNKKQVDREVSKMTLAKIYEGLGLIDKSEDLFLKELVNDKSSEKHWINYAIFNARHENFDKMATCIDEVLAIEPKSLIGNILKVYLLFRTQKLPQCAQNLTFLKSIYGNVEELNSMERVINKIVGNENDTINSCSSTNEIIESIYSRVELSWAATHDEFLLSWQNSFIKCATFFIKIGCYDIAELCLGEYYEDYGINVNYLYLLAVIDSMKGNFHKALVHLNKIHKDDVANHQLNYSKIVMSIILNLLHIKNFEQAKETFNTYIKSCDNFLILFLLGSHYNSTNEYVIAMEFLIQATKLYQCHLAYRELGSSLLNLKMFELAEKSFLCALQYETNDTESWMKLKEIYEMQDRRDASKFSYLNI